MKTKTVLLILMIALSIGISSNIASALENYVKFFEWGSVSGGQGSGDGQFSSPYGVSIDSAGNVFVSEVGNYRVQKFTSDGTFLTKWGSYGAGDYQFAYPWYVAADLSGNVFVSDGSNYRVQKFTSNGTFIIKWGSYGTGNLQFSNPRGIGVDSLGNVYVADGGNNRIQKFTSDGTFITKWGSSGIENSQFAAPTDVAIDSSDNIYVLEYTNNRVQKFTSNGTFVTKWGSYGTGDSQFSSPSGIGVDSSGNVYVADAGNNRIQKFASDGTLLAKWSLSPPYAWDVAVSSSGLVYVSNWGYNKIQVFGTLAQGPIPVSSCGTLNSAGFTYVLTTDLLNKTGANTPCLEIRANDITLDCQGHIVDGTDGSGDDSGITVGYWAYGGVNNATVKNCNVTDFRAGIAVYASTNSLITNNIVSSNVNSGIALGPNSNYNTISNNTVSDTPITLQTSSNNNITKNTVRSGGNGIQLLSNSVNNIIANNNASNGTFGIYLQSSNNNLILNNILNSNTVGLSVSTACSNLTIVNNSMSSGGTAKYSGTGLGVYQLSNSLIKDNNMSANKYTGASIQSSSNNNIINNTIILNGYQGAGYGINYYSSSNNNFSRNRIYDNVQYEFYSNVGPVEISSMGMGNFWGHTNTAGPCFYAYGGPTNYTPYDTNRADLTDVLCSYTADFQLPDTMPPVTTANFNCAYGGAGWCSSPATMTLTAVDESAIAWTRYCIDQTNTCTPTINYTGAFTVSTLGIDFVRYNSADVKGYIEEIKSTNVNVDNVGCGDTITSDTTLSRDFINCTGNGIVFGADNIALDCAGHLISGGYGGSGIILSSRNLATARNCNIMGFSEGITSDYGANNTIINNNISSIMSAGISFAYSSDNLITGNNISKVSNEDTSGLEMGWYSDNNIISNNIISFNYYGMKIFYNSSNNIITNNRIDSNLGSGIYMYLDASDNTFINNTANSNDGNGINIRYDAGYNNVFINNNFSSNDDVGITITADYTNLTNNIVNSNNGTGIRIGSRYNNIINNTVSFTGYIRDNNRYGSGILISNVNNTIIGNDFSSNTVDGILLSADYTSFSASYNTFINNIVNSNGEYGVELSRYSSGPVSYCTFDNNIVSSNGMAGFSIYDTNYNTFTNNIVNSNSENFDIINSNFTTLVNNTANSADIVGFIVDGCLNTTFIHNTANSNYYNGFDIYRSHYTAFVNNVARGNNIGINFNSGSNNVLINNTVDLNGLGISLFGIDNTILTDNTISSSRRDGLIFYSASGNNITKNKIHSNGRYGVMIELGANNIFSQNDIYYNNKNDTYNTEYAVDSDAAIELSSGDTGNFWGHTNLSEPCFYNYGGAYTPFDAHRTDVTDSYCSRTPFTFFIVCTDTDGDGYDVEGGFCGPIDCDDMNESIFPGATIETDVYGSDNTGTCRTQLEQCSGTTGNMVRTRNATGPVAEICDGLDNDCDEVADEELGQTTCGAGACVHTINNCVAGEIKICDPLEGAGTEICEGSFDEDCVGGVDNGCACTNGDEQNCTGSSEGECNAGIETCVNGQWDEVCVGEVTPSAEICDGLDNDCDAVADEELGQTTCGAGACVHTINNCVAGEIKICDPLEGAGTEICEGSFDEDCVGGVDNGCACTNGDEQNCTGSSEGECNAGIETCVNGQWNEVCVGKVTPSAEICDGLDNDCDAVADEELGQTTCGDGMCAHTINNCVGGEIQICDPLEGAGTEICEGSVDEDCVGGIDNGCACINGHEQNCTGSSEGECNAGIETCVNGQWDEVCVGEVTPSAEICDGLDNDCDGIADDGLGTTTCGDGICAHTINNCVGGEIQICDPLEGAGTEICEGSVDEDCVGGIDNGCACINGHEQNCTGSSEGECNAGIETCVNGQWDEVCVGEVTPSAEICDGLDNDCDGIADDGLGTTTCGDGICAHTINNCVAGIPQTCDPLEGQQTEVCNGIDDNCNNEIDEGFDQDADTVANCFDNCWSVANLDQADTNTNCPLQPYLTDPACGDACEISDADGDGIADELDNCPTIYNPNQNDSDEDGYGDMCDNCPIFSNSDQNNTITPNDGIGDACTAVMHPKFANLDPIQYPTVPTYGIDLAANTYCHCIGDVIPVITQQIATNGADLGSWLIRHNLNGANLWQFKEANVTPYAIEMDAGRNLIVAGKSVPSNTIAAFKYAKNGIKRWLNTSIDSGVAYSIAADSNGATPNYYLAGKGGASNKAFVLKLSNPTINTSSKQWIVNYNIYDNISKVYVNSLNDVVALAGTNILVIDSVNGALKNSKNLTTIAGINTVYALAMDMNNNLYALVKYYDSGAATYFNGVQKLDSSLTTIGSPIRLHELVGLAPYGIAISPADAGNRIIVLVYTADKGIQAQEYTTTGIFARGATVYGKDGYDLVASPVPKLTTDEDGNWVVLGTETKTGDARARLYKWKVSLLDKDGDRIYNTVDKDQTTEGDLSTVYSSDFKEAGTINRGTITDLGQETVRVVNGSSIDLKAAGSTTLAANISACGGRLIKTFLDAQGTSFNCTASIHLYKVEGGEEGGILAYYEPPYGDNKFFIPTGADIIFHEEDTFVTITVAADSPAVIIMHSDGTNETLAPGTVSNVPYVAASPVTSCGVLSSAGTTYALTQDVSSTGTCFQITANNITLDCAGHTIAGTGRTGWGVYWWGGQIGVTVKNCNINNFDRAITMHNSAGNFMIGNSFANNNYGVYLSGYSGDNTVTGNTFNNNAYEVWWEQLGGYGGRITNNTLLDSCKKPVNGLQLFDMHSGVPFCAGTYQTTGVTTYTNNITIDCGGATLQSPTTGANWGVYWWRGETGITVKNCNIMNYERGIAMNNANGNTMLNNSFTNNNNGIQISQYSGENTITNNKFQNNTREIFWDGQYGALAPSSWRTGNVILDSCKTPVDNFQMYEMHSGIPFCPGTYTITTPVWVQANNIVVDGNGATLQGVGTNNGIIWWRGETGITVKNLVLKNFDRAITMHNSANNIITGNDISNSKYGLYLSGYSGVNTVYHNNLYSNSVLQVFSELEGIELSYNQEGNWWGRTTAPYFIAGVDSNRANVVDSYPYAEQSGWVVCGPHSSKIGGSCVCDAGWLNLNGDWADGCESAAPLWEIIQPAVGPQLESTVAACTDGLDNDCDGLIDTADTDCDATPPITTSSFVSTEWQKSDISIDLSCADPEPGSGCDKTYYCIDSIDSCAPTIEYISTVAHSTEGIGYIRFYSTDNLGNAETVNSQVLKIDKMPPTTTAAVDCIGGDAGWCKSAATIALNATDDRSDVAWTKYCTDATDSCAPETTYAAPFTLTAQETTYARYQSADNAGNVEGIKSTAVKVDTAAPTTTAAYTGTLGEHDWYTSDVSVQLSATDATSGVRTMYVCADQSNECSPAAGSSATITTEGTNYVRYYSVDNADNAEELLVDIVSIDKTNPSIAINTLATYDGDGAFVVSWIGSDTISDALSYEVYRNNALYRTITGTSITESGLADATTYSYYVKAIDWAGRSSTSGTTSTTVDLYPPSVPDMTPLPQYTKVMQVIVDWTEATDVVSGVKNYNLYKDALSSINTGLVTEYTDSDVAEATTYSYAASATDNVNHESVKSDATSTTIDTLPPVTTHAISGTVGLDQWYVSSVGIILSSADATSGVARTYYRLNSGAWNEYTGTFLLSDGTWNVEYYAVDIAGNDETIKSFAVKVDAISPTTTSTFDCTMGDAGWCISEASVSLAATDDMSDVAWTKYCTDIADSCAPVIKYTTPFTIAAQGTTYGRYQSADNAGNVELIDSIAVKIDGIAPTTTAKYTGTAGEHNWYTSDVSVQLSATDATSGVRTMYVCVDQSNECSPAAGSSATITTEGTNYVRYYSDDDAGNAELLHSDVILIDKTNPNVAIEALATYDGDGAFVVSWIGSDTISDALSYEVYRNNALYRTITGTSITESGLSDATTYSYYVKAIDWAGRSSTSATTSTTIDLYPPSVPDMTPLPQYTKVMQVIVDWTEATDVVSGVKNYNLYKDSLAAINTGLTTKYTDGDVAEATTYSYAASATDNVNHESIKSDATSTTIDTQPPITTHAIEGAIGDNGWHKSAVGITLSSSDAVSGVAMAYYRINAGEWNDYAGTFQLSDGTWTVEYYAVDIAGNTETAKSFIVKVDTVPTTTTSSFVSAEWQKSDISIDLSCVDPTPASGCDKTYYCIDATDSCIPTIEHTSTIVHATEGISYVRFYSADKAGNAESTYSQVLKLDKTVPIIADDYANDGIWVKADQLVTLSPTDEPSGVQTVQYCEGAGCAPTTLLDSPYTLDYTTDQDTIVRYQVTDNAYNPSLIGAYNVKLDKTAPTAAVLAALAEWNTVGTVELSWQASTDARSGVKHYEVWRKDGAAGAYAKVSANLLPGTLSFTDSGLPTDITYHYKIITYDNAGNLVESNIARTTVDTENPAVQITSPLNEQIFKVNSVTVSADYANTYTVTCAAQVDSQTPVDMTGDGAVSGTATHIFTGLSDGLHSFTVDCQDTAGNHQTDSVANVRVDTVPTTTTSSFTATTWQKNDISIDLSCVDPTPASGCDKTYYCIDSTDSCIPTIEHTSTIVHATEGISYVRFYSADIAGNVEFVNSQILKLDKTPPTITDDYVNDGVWVKSDQTVTLAPADSPSGIKEVAYCKGEGCEPTTLLDSPYTLDYTTDQDTIVRYQVTDNAYNPSLIGAYNVKLDKTAPTAAVLSALAEWNTVGTVELSWQASTDARSGFEYYEVWRSENNGEFHKISGNLAETSYSDPGLLTDTYYEYKIISYDVAGNLVDSNIVHTTIDTENPAVQITSPLDSQTFKVSTITLSADYANTYTVQCQAQVDSQTPVDMTGDGAVSGTATHIFAGLSDGLHSFTVDCQDTAGNHQTDSVVDVRVDTIAPATTSSFVSAEWQNADIKIDLSCADPAPGSGCLSAYYCIDAANSCEPITPFSGTIIHTVEGAHYFRFMSIDKAGNSELAKSQILKLDKTLPIIADDYANDGTWVNADQLVTLSPTDEPSGVQTVNYCEGAGCAPTTLLDSPYTLDYTTDQDTIVRYQVTDNAYNPSLIGAYNVKLDKTAPTAAVLSALPEWSNTGDADLSWTASTDLLSGVKHYEVWRKSGTTGVYAKVSENLLPETLSFTDTGLATDVTYYYKVRAYDNAGNYADSNEQSITVDTDSPSVQITAPLDEQMFTASTIALSADYANTYTVQCQAQVDSQTPVDMTGDGAVSGTATHIFAGLSDGLHSFTVDCQDTAGNHQTDSVANVRVDTAAPVSFDDYAYDDSWTNVNAIISLSAFDPTPGSGVEWTRYCVDQTNSCAPITNYIGSPVIITTEGTYYVRYHSKDVAGNTEGINVVIVKLDKIPPTVNIDIAGSGLCQFWKQSWTDLATNAYQVVHGCAELNGVIDASIAGLATYKITLKDSQTNVVATSTDSPLQFDFATDRSSYQILLEATDNAGNFNTISKMVYEDDDEDVHAFPADNGGAPDLFDQCPTLVPNIDANKNGCQDSTETQANATSFCIDTYSGSSTDSLYPITGAHVFGTDYYKGKELWYNLRSSMDTGNIFDYDLTINYEADAGPTRTKCSIKTEQIITSTNRLLREDEKADTTKLLSSIDEKGKVKMKEHYHNHDWNDGAHVQASMKYNDKSDSSDLHLTYNNDDGYKQCEQNANNALTACTARCDKRDKVCITSCNDAAAAAKKICQDSNHYQIRNTYAGYKTLSQYDVLKLIGYE